MRLLYTTTIIAILSCNTNSKDSTTTLPQKSIYNTFPHKDNTKNKLDTVTAKNWITQSIHDFFTGKNTDMQKITTPEYYEFKLDAMNVDLGIDGSLSEDEFKNKWQKKYDLNLHPTQVGFLISGQDWGSIKVSQLFVKNINTSNDSITFHTLIRDEEYRINYSRDIILIENDGKYLIADILEYD